MRCCLNLIPYNPCDLKEGSTMKKNVFAIVTLVCLLLAALPVGAFATETA